MKKINFLELGKALLILMGYMLFIPDLVVFIFRFLNLDLSNRLIYVLAYVFIYLLTFILIGIFYGKSLKEEFKLYRNNFKKDFKIGLKNWGIALIFMVITNSLVLSLVGDMATNETVNRSMISEMPLFSVISMALIGPFIEEMLFRKNFRKSFNSKQLFMIFTALLFGGAHMLSAFTIGDITSNYFQILYIIPYSGIGYFFAKSYIETDTIFTSVTTHVLHNSLSVCLVLLSSFIGA